MNDNELIRKARSENKAEQNEAWRHIKTNYWRMCRTMMYQAKVPPEDQCGIFQESILVLCNRLRDQKFILSGKLSGFFYSVCQNKMHEYFRDQKRQQGRVSYHELSNEPAADTKNPYDEDINQHRIKLIRKAIQGLGVACRKLLVAYYYQGKSLKEIALELNYANENTVKTRKHDCISQIRRVVNPKKHD